MQQYHDLLRHIQKEGKIKHNRTGVDTQSVFGYMMRFDLAEGFPAVTTKKLNMTAVIHELLWFLSGETNIRPLVQNNVNIWTEWAFQPYLDKTGLHEKFPMYSDAWHEELAKFKERIIADEEFAKKWGDLGPVYGKQWRHWIIEGGDEVDQIKDVMETLQKNPESRRIIVSGWNIGDLQELVRSKHGAPPPCHTLFHFMVTDGKLSCVLYQRSADTFLGVPFNIASYSLLTMMIAHVAGLEPGEFIHMFGDVHIYENHKEQVALQLSRELRPLPKMIIKRKPDSIFDYKFDDFELVGYDPHPFIKALIAV